MPSATLYAVSHVAGTASSPANAQGAPNGVFTTDANANVSWISRWRMDTVAGDNAATGTQTITLRMRKGSNSGNPTLSGLNVWQNGVAVASIIGSSASITSTSGQDIARTFDGSVLAGLGSVDIEVVTTGAGGSPSTRNAAALDAITWSAVYETIVPVTGTLAASETGDDAAAIAGTVVTPSGVMSAQETGGDAFAGVGSIQAEAIRGALAAAEVGTDNFTSAGFVAISGAATGQETGNDAMSAVGSVSDAGLSGVLVAAEAGGDAFAGSGVVPVAATLAVVEAGGDVARMNGPPAISGKSAALRKKIVDSGASSVADLARNSRDFTMTVEDLRNYGAGMWPDIARMGRITDGS